MADDRDGYDENGIWIAAKRRCPVHDQVEPCDVCTGWIAAGY